MCRPSHSTSWHHVFLWWPRRVEGYTVWLETVERRGVCYTYAPDTVRYWEWRLPTGGL